jgi:hypothetical protein
MSAAADVLPVVTEPPKYFQEGASGVLLAVFAFGFSVIALLLANAEIV